MPQLSKGCCPLIPKHMGKTWGDFSHTFGRDGKIWAWKGWQNLSYIWASCCGPVTAAGPWVWLSQIISTYCNREMDFYKCFKRFPPFPASGSSFLSQITFNLMPCWANHTVIRGTTINASSGIQAEPHSPLFVCLFWKTQYGATLFLFLTHKLVQATAHR